MAQYIIYTQSDMEYIHTLSLIQILEYIQNHKCLVLISGPQYSQ